jgi:hypothetical protein
MVDYYLGYVTSSGVRGRPQRIENISELISFLKTHLHADEVVVTDPGDNLLFRAVDGVDLYSELERLGIDLPGLYRDIRQGMDSLRPDQATNREPWEQLYDSIGLSPGEIQMRQRVKRLCKAARTVADVARLLEGTYFDAHFYSEDRARAWGYFKPEDNSVYILAGSEEDGWGESQETTPVTLSPGARVRHISSGEDIHRFILYDPPDK